MGCTIREMCLCFVSNAPELTVLESVLCPQCSTQYGLKVQRVRPGMRRARCFRCWAVFSIEAEVHRLLGIPEPEVLPPSLTLGDLEGVEDELVEKTHMTEESPVERVPMAEFQEPLPDALSALVPPDEDIPEVASGNYRSAKDAISRLLGDAPVPEVSSERRNPMRSSNQMDVEATLNALESTLGGIHPKDLETKPQPTPPADLQPFDFEPTKPMASTLKLTHEEIAAAMMAPPPAPRTVKLSREEVAAALTAANPVATRPIPIPPPVTPAAPTVASSPSHPATPEVDTGNLLKVQVGQETYTGVSLEEITVWIEQGRVQSYHMVARQFSDNWIEASKVSALRPIFDRLKKQQAPAAQQSQATLQPLPSDTTPIKKSLFGGLFNRG